MPRVGQAPRAGHALDDSAAGGAGASGGAGAGAGPAATKRVLAAEHDLPVEMKAGASLHAPGSPAVAPPPWPGAHPAHGAPVRVSYSTGEVPGASHPVLRSESEPRTKPTKVGSGDKPTPGLTRAWSKDDEPWDRELREELERAERAMYEPVTRAPHLSTEVHAFNARTTIDREAVWLAAQNPKASVQSLPNVGEVHGKALEKHFMGTIGQAVDNFVDSKGKGATTQLVCDRFATRLTEDVGIAPAWASRITGAVALAADWISPEFVFRREELVYGSSTPSDYDDL